MECGKAVINAFIDLKTKPGKKLSVYGRAE
jgi:hypothetical protein